MPLTKIFEGWEGYQRSLVNAVRPLTAEQLAWRPAPHLRAVGELVGHIGQGRLDWFTRMQTPRDAEFSDQAGAESQAETLYGNAEALVRQLGRLVGDDRGGAQGVDRGRPGRDLPPRVQWAAAIRASGRSGVSPSRCAPRRRSLALMLGIQGIAVPEPLPALDSAAAAWRWMALVPLTFAGLGHGKWRCLRRCVTSCPFMNGLSLSRQWTIWRILTHDVHHGGELALMLGMLRASRCPNSAASLGTWLCRRWQRIVFVSLTLPASSLKWRRSCRRGDPPYEYTPPLPHQI